MNKTLITFATTDFEEKRNFTVNSMSHFFQKNVNYSLSDMNINFIEENNYILSLPRGAGYWLWKPYFILKYLNSSNLENEMIVYCDSGDYISDATLEKAEKFLQDNSCLFVKGNFINKQWTKRDCFVLMNCDDEIYWNNGQVYASISFWKNTEFSRSILKEWLDFCKNKNILTDLDNICEKNNFDDFIDHRHDQSVFTNIAIKNNLKTETELYSNPWTF
jgi:hypothetical protein